MTSTLSNQAAWLMGKGQQLNLSDAPVPQPGPKEILVRNHAIALNPFDGIVQALGSMFTPWIKYPAILGSDVSGEVIAIGSSVSRFKLGDRVIGLALGIDKMANRAAEGAFQNYVILRESATTKIPNSISFEQAAVLPLAVATAACGLFLKDQLGLQRPSANTAASTGKVVLIWGGSTSVGSCAIQLATAAGYEVATTTSPRNFSYVRKLGAKYVFDYHDPNVVTNIVNRLKNHELAGALAISPGSGSPCITIVRRCKGTRIVSMASPPIPVSDAPLKGQFIWKLTHLPRIAAGFLSLAIQARLARVTTHSIWGTALLQNELGNKIFADFLGPALENGRFIPAPEPFIAGTSISDIPHAMEILKKGVSAQKVVVSISE